MSSITKTWSVADQLRHVAANLQYEGFRPTMDEVDICRRAAAGLERRHTMINHFRSEHEVARALSTSLMGDDVDWKQHMTHARRFLDAMEKSLLAKLVDSVAPV